jgi:hypothetical protein
MISKTGNRAEVISRPLQALPQDLWTPAILIESKIAPRTSSKLIPVGTVACESLNLFGSDTPPAEEIFVVPGGGWAPVRLPSVS